MSIGYFSAQLWNDKGGIVLQRTCYIPSPLGNLLLKTAIGADRTTKPPLRCLLLLHSSLTLLPGHWDCRQSCKYTLGATFIIISQKFLIERHKSFSQVTIARHNIKHVLWHVIAARVAFYSWPGLFDIPEWWFQSIWLMDQGLSAEHCVNKCEIVVLCM